MRAPGENVQKMLLQLPKDILSYILSITVRDEYVDLYCKWGMSTDQDHFHTLTQGFQFSCVYAGSPLAVAMHRLSCVHPLFRQILLHACITQDSAPTWIARRWCFKESFFLVLFPVASSRTCPKAASRHPIRSTDARAPLAQERYPRDERA